MSQHDGVVVDVDHPGGWVHRLDDLVQVGFGGDAGADVEELVDPLLGQIAHCPVHERPVVDGSDADGRKDLDELLVQQTVGVVVGLSTECVVVSARGVGAVTQ